MKQKINYYPCLYWCGRLYVLRTSGSYLNLASDRVMVSYGTKERVLKEFARTRNEYDGVACKKVILEDADFKIIDDVYNNDEYSDYQKKKKIYELIKDKFVI